MPAGAILTHPEICLPPSDASLLVSVARSGNSPESRAAVDWLLEVRPRVRHLFVTCNKDGALATSYAGVQGVRSVVLPDETNDESLVMTSSFTSLVLAGLGLGVLDALDAYEARARALSQVAAAVLVERSDALAAAARSGFGSALYLGSGCRLGAAREAALKMLEMNAGKVATMAESFLGLRHGPMSAVHADTLVVAFLSSDPLARAYELDLLRELRRKEHRRAPGGRGRRGPGRGGDGARRRGRGRGRRRPELGDDELALVDVLVSQLLAFFRCLDAGFRPDSPSDDGIITRVVSDFEIHRREDPRRPCSGVGRRSVTAEQQLDDRAHDPGLAPRPAHDDLGALVVVAHLHVGAVEVAHQLVPARPDGLQEDGAGLGGAAGEGHAVRQVDDRERGEELPDVVADPADDREGLLVVPLRGPRR